MVIIILTLGLVLSAFFLMQIRKSVTLQIQFSYEPSIIPNYSILKRIVHKYNVKNLSDEYSLCGRAQWIYYRRPKYYQYFDSYEKRKEKDSIPEDKLEVW